MNIAGNDGRARIDDNGIVENEESVKVDDDGIVKHI